MTPERVPYKDLTLGDVVDLEFPEGYGTATVVKVDEQNVHLFRPYTHTSDFAYTGGVIPYVGIETFSVPRSAKDRTLLRLRKGGVPR